MTHRIVIRLPSLITSTPTCPAVTARPMRKMNFIMVRTPLYVKQKTHFNLGECILGDCEEQIREFRQDYRLNYVAKRLKEKIEEYKMPQDDSHRNRNTPYGEAFNGYVKAIALTVRDSRKNF